MAILSEIVYDEYHELFKKVILKCSNLQIYHSDTKSW
jgi:hypothetical protein